MDFLTFLSNVALDAVVLAFIKNNIITVSIGWAALKGLAAATPWNVDNKILSMIGIPLSNIPGVKHIFSSGSGNGAAKK